MRRAPTAERSAGSPVGAHWYGCFREALRSSPFAEQLKAAADGARLGPWTELLTGAVVDVCHGVGWTCAAKRAGDRPLPIERDEYLGIDVLAFQPGAGWRPPLAAFELENSRSDPLVAYALWKACTVGAPVACLFCYRRSADAIGSLMAFLQAEVLGRLPAPHEVLVVVGTRATAETFPDGYFRPFSWDGRSGRLVPMVGTP